MRVLIGSYLSHSRFIILFLLIFNFPSMAATSTFQPLIWVDLLPAEDLSALMNPPPIMHITNEEGTRRQSLRRDGLGGFLKEENDPFQLALVSTKIKPEMNNLDVRLAGFVVPLEYGEEEKVTEFFLVPYFGACIHTPPPPPNQIVYVEYPSGLKLESIYEPFNIEGKLLTEQNRNALGLSAYKIKAVNITPYTEEDQQ